MGILNHRNFVEKSREDPPAKREKSNMSISPVQPLVCLMQDANWQQWQRVFGKTSAAVVMVVDLFSWKHFFAVQV
jgi:hypothetical protein